MLRKLKLWAAALLPVSFLSAQKSDNTSRQSSYEQHRKQSLEINKIAGNITCIEDARKLVNLLADMFGEDLPGKLRDPGFLDRVARSEYASAIDPSKRIPEQHIADAWSAYVTEIGAPYEARATAAEIHNLRDALFSLAAFSHGRESGNIWDISMIYATRPDSSLDANCRIIESFRVVWDLANMHENHTSARDRVQKGELVSTWMKAQEGKQRKKYSVLMVRNSPLDPVRAAEMNYVQQHGQRLFRKAVERLAFAILPDSQ